MNTDQIPCVPCGKRIGLRSDGVLYRHDNANNSGYCVQSLKVPLCNSCHTERIDGSGWPDDDGGVLCQGCWEEACAVSFWAAVDAGLFETGER